MSPANGHGNEWGEEPTTHLPRYRTISLGCPDTGPLIHVTPTGHHYVDADCDGVCLVCLNPLQATS